MTMCVTFFQKSVMLFLNKVEQQNIKISPDSKGKRKEMFNQLIKINLILLMILLLNGISNSYQQKSNSSSEEALNIIAKLQSGHPLTSKILGKRF